MNIFVLSNKPAKAAAYLCDKHCGKMLLETAQLLCSAFPKGAAPYKRTHYNHPCAKWVRESQLNYLWLLSYGTQLNLEYYYRFGKFHKSGQVISWCLDHNKDLNLPLIPQTPFALAMPDEYKIYDNPVWCYRLYYKKEKARFAKWANKREKPYWWNKKL